MRLVAYTVFLLITLTFTAGPSAAKNPAFEQLGAQILESLQSFYPVRSTAMGIHSYDHRFTDFSSKSVKDMLQKLTDYEKRLYKYKTTDFALHEAVNYRLLKSNVDIAILDLKRIKWYKRSPHLYTRQTVDGIYYLILSSHAPLQERVVSILSRMKTVPDFLATARKNISKPPRADVEAAIETLESGMQFYKDIAAELSNKFPQRADELSRVSTLAREAMNEFTVYLSGIACGPENSFSIGKDNFDYMLQHEYFLSYNSDSLLTMGESLLAAADSAYREHLGFVENNQNGSDSVFVPANFTRQDILDYYNWEIEQLRIFLHSREIVSLPETAVPLSVVETPPFLRMMVPGVAYQPPGPFESDQRGYFYVRPIPDDLDRRQLEALYRYVHRRGFKGSAVQEGYPGHHLLVQLAGLNPDPIRKWQHNPMMIEGWSLYCEEMMYRQGLYGVEDHAQWLTVLSGIRFRAAGIIADVKLHTGRFTFDECVRWMIDALGVTSESEKDFIRTEVRRYLTTPTCQMSHLMGKLEITALLESARKQDGENFNLMSFHDRLLGEGAIPPALMWEIMGLNRTTP